MLSPKKRNSVLLGLSLVALAVVWALGVNAALAYLANDRTTRELAVFSRLTQNQKYDFIHQVLDTEGVDAVNRLLVGFGAPSAGGLTYQFGTFMYEKYGTSGIGKCPKALLLGCRAGVLRAALMEHGTAVLPEFRKACGEGKPGIGYSCGHGIGHGTAELTHFDIPKSLAYCDTLESYARVPCYGGVFQEYLEFAPAADFSEKDLWQPCTGLAATYRAICAFNLPDLWNTRYQYDDTKQLSLCGASTDSVMRENCYLGVGFRLVKEDKGDISKIVSDCSSLFPETAAPLCYIAASNVLGVYTYKDWQHSVITVCSRLEGDLHDICLKASTTHTIFETNTLLSGHVF